MPKVKESASVKLKAFVSKYGENIFSTDGRILFCKICDVRVAAEKKFTIEQHMSREKHKRGLQRLENKSSVNLQQMLLGDTCSTFSPFCEKLCEAFLSADISLHKLNHPKLRTFLEEETGKLIPDPRTLRRTYIARCYDKTLKKIREMIGERNVFVSIDETTDSMGRYVANVIVGVLEAHSPGEQFLLHCEQLDKVNYSTISLVFDHALRILWPDGIRNSNVLLFITDAAPYMMKAAASLSALYPKMVHVTCLAHALHRVAEEVRANFPEVDKLIGCVKKVFLKAPSRISAFKTEAPEIQLPFSPVLTRWGTWLQACSYYCKNFDVVKKVVDSFDNGESVSIKKAQELLADKEIAGKLSYINTNFGFLPDVITALEKSQVTLVEQLQIVDKVVNDLSRACGKVGDAVSMKMKNCLSKNRGYTTLCSIGRALSGENFSLPDCELNPGDIACFQFAPIVSVEVERSFSIYKSVLADNRQSFLFENLRQVLIVNCNSKLL